MRAGLEAIEDARRLLADGLVSEARTRLAEGRAVLEAAGAGGVSGKMVPSAIKIFEVVERELAEAEEEARRRVERRRDVEKGLEAARTAKRVWREERKATEALQLLAAARTLLRRGGDAKLEAIPLHPKISLLFP